MHKFLVLTSNESPVCHNDDIMCRGRIYTIMQIKHLLAIYLKFLEAKSWTNPECATVGIQCVRQWNFQWSQMLLYMYYMQSLIFKLLRFGQESYYNDVIKTKHHLTGKFEVLGKCPNVSRGEIWWLACIRKFVHNAKANFRESDDILSRGWYYIIH